MHELVGALRSYAWGSRTALAELCGRPVPSAHPEAELWFGAHPADPAYVTLAEGTTKSLLDLVAADPERELGAAGAQFGDKLPFLLKILAAEEPLSLQAHPSAEQARAGFERENRAGVPLDFHHTFTPITAAAPTLPRDPARAEAADTLADLGLAPEQLLRRPAGLSGGQLQRAALATYDPADDRFDISGVMGSDEYHDGYPDTPGGGQRNNTYTNVLNPWVLARARDIVILHDGRDCTPLRERLRLRPEEPARWDRISRRLRVPFHRDGIISQF
ncbi:type I phosphomannose isomerase catalytic subunit, partial [Nocardia farcinica]|uniref:type I phosphomannose isomerase catalytic subunit n=1 Tax=Nocardia farcinica TaxID=37329 RepID=UPI00313BF0ED